MEERLKSMTLACAMVTLPLVTDANPAQTPSGASQPASMPTVASVTTAAAPSSDVHEILVQLGRLEASLDALNKKASNPDHTAAWMSLLSALLGASVAGVIGYVGQKRSQEHQSSMATSAAAHAKQLADEKIKFEIGSSFVQWQLKQLSELYGPLQALFQQSNQLYRRMNEALQSADAQKFRLRDGEKADDFDGKVFEIFDGGDWRRFRTILDISHVYGAEYGIEEYFDELVAIGSRIVKVIEEKAGYTRPDQRELVELFGCYLAHYRVLTHVHNNAKAAMSGDTSFEVAARIAPMAVDKAAAFPQRIQGLIDEGYQLIAAELNRWQAKAT
jgi:hypothetical protein